MTDVEQRMRELEMQLTERSPSSHTDHEANVMLHMIGGRNREAALQEIQLEETFKAAHEHLLERLLPSIDDQSEDIEVEY